MSNCSQSGAEGLLGTELLSRDAGFGYSCTRVRIDDHIELEYSSDGGSFTVWIERADSDSPGYLRTGKYALGYRGDPPDRRAFDLMEKVAAKIRENEDAWNGRLVELAAGVEGDGPVVTNGRLEIRVTEKCNEHCPFCNTDENALNVMTDGDDIRDAIEKAAELGAWQLVFTGGEPTLARDLPSWVALARRSGLRVWIQTNGIIPGKPGFWDRFVTEKGETALPDALFVSFHTRFPERLEGLTGVSGTMQEKVRTVRSAIELGMDVGISYVISRLNLDETGDFPAFAASSFGPEVDLCFSLMAPTGRAVQNLSLIPSVPEVVPGLAKALDESCRLGMNALVLEACGFPICAMPAYARFFDANRPVSAPVGLPPDRVKWDFCPGCAYDDRCIGMWRRYVEVHGSEPFGPVPPDEIDS